MSATPLYKLSLSTTFVSEVITDWKISVFYKSPPLLSLKEGTMCLYEGLGPQKSCKIRTNCDIRTRTDLECYIKILSVRSEFLVL